MPALIAMGRSGQAATTAAKWILWVGRHALARRFAPPLEREGRVRLVPGPQPSEGRRDDTGWGSLLHPERRSDRRGMSHRRLALAIATLSALNGSRIKRQGAAAKGCQYAETRSAE
jgi:hypothetical protein